MLYAIFFHRLFGPVTPRTFDVLDVTVVCEGLNNLEYFVLLMRRQPAISDQETEQLVEEKVDMYSKAALVNGVR